MVIKITYFVHGTTTDNEDHLATGHAPGELSELGVQQAKELPEKMGDKKFDVVFCSDLKRAIDSAELGFKGTYDIIQDKRLRECDYGTLTEHPAGEFKDRMAEYIETAFPASDDYPGECYRDVENRIRDFLDFLKENYDGKHIAIVAHQAPQLALEVILNGKTWQQAIDEDWRRKDTEGTWQPGWDYVLE